MMLYVILAILLIWYLVRRKLRINHELSQYDTEDINIDDNFDYEVAIVGSGVLGSALAAVLGRDGRKVVVIERNMEMPERFVGELLQPGGKKALEELGLKDCLNDIDAQNVLGYSIFGRNGEEKVDLSYRLDSNGGEGKSFNNRRFVMNLRKAAKSEKNVTYIEGTVHNLVEKNNVTGVIYKPKGEEEEKILKAKLTVVAEGCFSQLRKQLVSEKPTQLSSFVAGIIQNCPTVKSNYAQLLITNSSPVILYQISSDQTRILVDVRDKIPMKDMKDYLIDVVCPQLPEQFREPFVEGISTVSLHSMPNSMMTAAPHHKNGVLVLGDALDLRHPITGNGMSVALMDIVMLRKLLQDVNNLANYKLLSKLKKKFYIERKKKHTFVVNILANAMFEIVAANDKWSKLLQDGTLKYYKLGGKYLSDCVDLLGSLNTNIHVFLITFSSIALYSVYLPFKSENRSSIFKSLNESIRVFGKVCTISVPLIWSELKIFF